MSMEVKSLYYNYYSVKGSHSPKTPETPSWRKQYEAADDHVKANNGNTESELYKAHCKLEEEYYSSAVANRSRYKDVDSLKKRQQELQQMWDSQKIGKLPPLL